MSEEMQLDLFKEFAMGPGHLSRVLPLWDLLPLYLYTRRTELAPSTSVADIPDVTNSFESRGEKISVSIAPAIMRDTPTSRARVVFPGEREALVSAAIRALAMRDFSVLGTHDDPKAGTLVSVAFTLRQLRAELASTGHAISHAQLTESLEILKRSIATVTRTRPGQEPIIQPTPFFYSIMNQGERHIAILNAIESRQILAGSYRAIDYSQYMEIPDPIARWLYQYIHTEHTGAVSPFDCQLGTKRRGFTVSLALLQERGLIAKSRRVRDILPRVRAALDLLADFGILFTDDDSPGYDEILDTVSTGGRRQTTGASWILYVSESMFQTIIDANTEEKLRKPQYSSTLSASDRAIDRNSQAARGRLHKRAFDAAAERHAKRLSPGK